MMEYNTNDQLRAYFINQIKSISEQEISKVKEEIERINQKKLAEIQASAKLSADLMLQQEIKMLNSEHALNISKLSEKNNQKKMMMREQLITELFNTIKKKLEAYTTSKEYEVEFLSDVTSISKQYAYDGLLHVKEADKDLALKAIKQVETSLEVVVDEAIEIGGFLLEFTNASLVVDQTLDARFHEEVNAFYKNSELILK